MNAGGTMPYFALFYDVVDDFISRRTPFREEHLRLVREARARGELLLAGALADPPAALLIFQSAGPETPESFAYNDPYVTNGLVTHWKVRPWAVVGNEEPARRTSGAA
jgi:uncharacterized protein